MSTQWAVKITGGGWMTGLHPFCTKKAARAFIERWRKAEDRADASATLLRNGFAIVPHIQASARNAAARDAITPSGSQSGESPCK